LGILDAQNDLGSFRISGMLERLKRIRFCPKFCTLESPDAGNIWAVLEPSNRFYRFLKIFISAQTFWSLSENPDAREQNQAVLKNFMLPNNFGQIMMVEFYYTAQHLKQHGKMSPRCLRILGRVGNFFSARAKNSSMSPTIPDALSHMKERKTS
jgi:hypothetical protein